LSRTTVSSNQFGAQFGAPVGASCELIDQTAPMVTWGEFETTEPDLSSRVRARFEASGLALVATLRADGSPRISGWEPLFTDGNLWLGCMPDSRKGADVRRDPRIALHSATEDKDVHDGDAKITGRAVDVTDEGTKVAFIRSFEAATGQAPPPGPMDLFRVDVGEVSMLCPGGDQLVIEWWRPEAGYHRIQRH
jgi:hypothetical protein